MNQIEAGDEITTTLPELKNAISRAVRIKNSYALIRVLSQYTQKMVELQHDQTVVQCMKLVGRLYSKGDSIIKNAVENVFVFSLDSILYSCSLTQRKKALNQLPTALYRAYLKQVYSTGV